MEKPVRVLRIEHSFVEPTNHAFLDEMKAFPELEVRAVCPRWGIESGNLRTISGAAREDLDVATTVLTKHYATTMYVNKLGMLIRRLKPDIISCHEEPYSLTAGQALAYAAAFSPGSKFVFCSAQNILKNYPPPFVQIEKWMYRRAAAGYGCCEGVREVARARGFSGRFDILPLGIDPQLFHYRKRDAVIEGRPFTIGYIGKVVEEKGVFTLLRAFAELRGGPLLHLLGDGPDKERLLNEARKAGVADRVSFVGPVPHREVPAVLDTFDALAVPSETTPTWKEQFGRVITEAFSVGVPVVGSDSGSIPEVVGDAGLIFEEKNHGQLASILQSLIDNPSRLPAMSEKGRKRVEEKFTWKKLARLSRNLFLDVVRADGGC